MHDIHKQSVEAAVQLIPMLIQKGYQLVTVSGWLKQEELQWKMGKLFTFRK